MALIHEDAEGRLPPAIYESEETGAKHSWRARALPDLYSQDLFDRIEFDEPWDSANNQQLHDLPIIFYRCPSATDKVTHTNYFVVTGENTAFPNNGRGLKSGNIVDEARTILYVESVHTGIHWMEPRDFAFEQLDFHVKNGSGGPDSEHTDVVNVVMADGSTLGLARDIDPEVVKALLTRRAADDQPVRSYFDD